MELNIRSLAGISWRLILSLAFSFGILAIFFQLLASTGKTINLSVLITTISKVSGSLLLVYIVLQLIQTIFRTLRYQLLIKASNEDEAPGFLPMFLVTGTRNMAVDLLPARLGELIYVFMLNRGFRVPAGACLSSLTISILFDIAILVPVVLTLAVLPLATDALQERLIVGSVVIVIALTIAVGLIFYALPRIAQYFSTGKRTFIRLPDKLVGLIQDVTDAFERTRKAGVIFKTLLYTAGVRVSKYLALYSLFLAVTIPNFSEFGDIGFARTLAVLLVSEASASLPVPSFMGFGVYEGGGVVTLTLMGYPVVQATLAVLATHIWSQAVDYSIGALCIFGFLMVTRAHSSAGTTSSRLRRLLLAAASAVILVISVTWALITFKEAQNTRAAVAPPAGAPMPDSKASRNAREQTRDLNAFVVWSSNRFGNHELVMLRLPEWKLTRLTNDPHVDTFPRISPDGRQIVFARSQKLWVPQRNPVPWDAYILDLPTGKERRVARFANSPTWSADGRAIFFQRAITQFVRLDLSSGKETILFSAGSRGLRPGVELQTPTLEPRGDRLAVTLRRRQRLTGLVSATTPIQKVGGGCQLSWAPDASYLYYVDDGGRKKNMIFKVDKQTLRPSPWLDLPNPYSHEYFPKVSNDMRQLVLGASSKGHEHDSADYEIFLWPIGSANHAAVRLSYHSGNDNWPDIFVLP